jgi:hypothetical protein
LPIRGAGSSANSIDAKICGIIWNIYCMKFIALAVRVKMICGCKFVRVFKKSMFCVTTATIFGDSTPSHESTSIQAEEERLIGLVGRLDGSIWGSLRLD